jgi:hypothetical protein
VTDEQPVGYLKSAVDFNDHHLRWKITGAVVEHAKEIVEAFDSDEQHDLYPLIRAQRAVWEWETVGEVFARHLIFGLKIDPEATDEVVLAAVQQSWDYIMGGMPPRE